METTTDSIHYEDKKAKSLPKFGILSKLMWSKARMYFPFNTNVYSSYNVSVIDGCMGGGSLLADMHKEWSAMGYENDYGMYAMANGLFTEKGLDVDVINAPFERHFSKPFFPEYNLAISVPYCDRAINKELEKDADYLKIKNYAYYCIARSMDVLITDGIGIFAIPCNLTSGDFEQDKEFILRNASIIFSEKFENYTILTLKKK